MSKTALNQEVKFTTYNEPSENNYNPLLLYLWKANLDIQYVADSTLALVHYVTGYITKAEKSHIQELWEVNKIDNWLNQIHIQMICTKLTSSITFTQIGHLLLLIFVSLISSSGTVEVMMRRQYVRVGKPKIPNHRIYDPNKPNEREAYFYSLLLLFVPITDESQLVGEGKTAEEAFNEHFKDHSSMEDHHESLQRMLQAQENK